MRRDLAAAFATTLVAGCHRNERAEVHPGGSPREGDDPSQVIEGFIGFVPATSLAITWNGTLQTLLASPDDYDCDDVVSEDFPYSQFQASSMKFAASILAEGAPDAWVGDYVLGGPTERWGEERFAAAFVQEWVCEEVKTDGSSCPNTTHWIAADGTLSITAVGDGAVTVEMAALGYVFDIDAGVNVEGLPVTARLEAKRCDFELPPLDTGDDDASG